jgi:ketosteroid isomerase-like protein
MRFLKSLFFLVASTTFAFAQASEEDEVKRADAMLNQFILKNQAREAATFYAHEFVLTTSSGSFKNKEDMIRDIASPELVLEKNATEDVDVKVQGATAVLIGVLHQKGSYKGKAFDAWLLVTDTWIRTVKGWQLLAGHASIRPKT